MACIEMVERKHRRAIVRGKGQRLPRGLRELAFLAQLDIRVDAGDQEAHRRLTEVLGFGLPIRPNTVGGDSSGRYSLWLGPTEWLVVDRPGVANQLQGAITSALWGSSGAVLDVSSGRRTFELSGSHAREALESGCPIDLHPRSFVPGHCAQTVIARANILLHEVTEEPRYRLMVRPSYAPYLIAWLSDAIDAIP